MKNFFAGLVMSALFLPIASAAAATLPKVVFIGDGTTYGWSLPANSNWVNKGLPGIGYFGQTAETVYDRFGSDVVSLHPAIVHIMVGANDELEDDDATRPDVSTAFAATLDEMVKEAEAANIKVILGIEPNDYFLAAVVAGYGAAHNIPVINYSDALCGCVASTGGSGVGYAYTTGNPSGESQFPLTAPGAGTPPQSSLGMTVPTAQGYALMIQMAQAAISTLSVTLKSGYLQNISLPYEGANPVANVNTVSGDQVLQFTPHGVYSDGSVHPLLNTSFAGTNGTWTTDNPLVMSITQDGLAWALAEGTATIRFTPPNGAKFSSWVMHVSSDFVN